MAAQLMRGLYAGCVDWIFGCDFFISYSHDDGMCYPERLKQRLLQGFRVGHQSFTRNAWLRRQKMLTPGTSSSIN
jgi:hypothetical protein